MIKLRGEEIVWQSIEGEVVVLDLRSSVYLAVKGSGAVLWPQVVEGATREDLVGALVDRYAIPVEQAGRDVDAFVTMLRDRELLGA
ncbi:coenzyme PQQ synthesis protein D (PqqD) [Blastococcus colisei]|uniref:Coenzyme PQQ synthesis protein D (PqqD) n=1 Tax=Blastococcus colisei TaxID=1564162 RepID=A0A543P1K0_9ACTN|nr:PqqD family protein [Blastococcus colisei]TQN37941.1 coenzyme PQQ synthesis protein D (PqqD) [Blastococcus colisei]